jgi:hypothetical protein
MSKIDINYTSVKLIQNNMFTKSFKKFNKLLTSRNFAQTPNCLYEEQWSFKNYPSATLAIHANDQLRFFYSIIYISSIVIL